MSLQDEQARAERDAPALRSILARYPDAKREDGATGIIIASVPMSAATVVNVDAGKGGRQFVRFGDGDGPDKGRFAQGVVYRVSVHAVKFKGAT